mgnify:FL=1|jgi:hypothetical protein
MTDRISKSVLKLRRKALAHNWLPCIYYYLGYRNGFIKTQGRKWFHVVYLGTDGSPHVRRVLPQNVTVTTLENMRVGKIDARWERKRITQHGDT